MIALVRWTERPVARNKGRFSYGVSTGIRRTLWILFLPIFSITKWES